MCAQCGIKKGIINLDIFYDDWMNKKTGQKKWNHALITFMDNGKYESSLIKSYNYGFRYNDQIGINTVENGWSIKDFEQELFLKFDKKEDVKYDYGLIMGRFDGGGIAKKYYFTSILDPKIHVNFITEVISGDTLESSSNYPKFFASIEIYTEDDEKSKILADEKRQQEQAKQDKLNQEKKQQEKRKSEALKQLGIQD